MDLVGSISRAWSTSSGGKWMRSWSGSAPFESDDPLLTARPPGPRCPARVVLDSTARLACLESQLARTAREVPVIVAVTERALSQRPRAARRARLRGDRIPRSCGRVPIARLLEELGRRGMTNVLVEGGGRVLGSFLDAGQVDAVEVFIAPILEGGDHARTAARGKGMRLHDATPPDCAVSSVTGSAATSTSVDGCLNPGASRPAFVEDE